MRLQSATFPILRSSRRFWKNIRSTPQLLLSSTRSACSAISTPIRLTTLWLTWTKNSTWLFSLIMRCTTRMIDSGNWWSRTSIWWDAHWLESTSILNWRTSNNATSRLDSRLLKFLRCYRCTHPTYLSYNDCIDRAERLKIEKIEMLDEL